MIWRANVSAWFLLVATVFIIPKSKAGFQEIHIEVHDSDFKGWPGEENGVWPPPEKPARHRRMLNHIDREAIIDTLNRLRRSLGAPDMYYVMWDRGLEDHAADLTSSCDLQIEARNSLGAKYARGLTGYARHSDVASAIQKVYIQGANSTFYWQIMSSHLMFVGCAVGFQPCKLGHVFTCLFSYSRSPTKQKPTNLSSSLPVCSQCDKDALWCDTGLCRTRCRKGDDICKQNDGHNCEKTCSRCHDAVSSSNCQCVCYYANDQRRCTGKSDNAAYATKIKPICTAEDTGDLDVPVGFLILVVCLLLVFITIFILVVCCMTRCRSLKRRQRQLAGATRRSEPHSDSTPADNATSSTTTSAFVVSPPFIMTPPPYVDLDGTDSRPPPYCECLSADDHGTQLCSVADLPTPLSVAPTAPPSNDGHTGCSDDHADIRQTHGNAAFSDAGV